jgi:ABC-type multidrug transport system ATPase subunit
MDEAEVLADEVVIVHEGRVLFSGTIEEARRAVGHKFKVEVYGDLEVEGYEGLRLKGVTVFYVDEGGGRRRARESHGRGLRVRGEAHEPRGPVHQADG